MFVARLFPKDSTYFKQSQGYFSKLGKTMDSGGWMNLFPIWALVISGIVVNLDYNDRYIYWDWGGWILGLSKLVLVTFIYFLFLRPKMFWQLGMKILNLKEILFHAFIAMIFLLIGWLDSGIILSTLPILIPYCFAFLSGVMIFQFQLELDKENGVWNHFEWTNKIEFLSTSLILMALAIFLSILYDDPILSTSAAVSFPFPLITLLWPNHVRHLQRARIFPLFTLTMFLCVRLPWFLIPVAILFFVIRTINYFRYGIIYPSFGVDFLEEN